MSPLSLGWGCGGIWGHRGIILVLVTVLVMTSSLPLGWGHSGAMVVGMLGVLWGCWGDYDSAGGAVGVLNPMPVQGTPLSPRPCTT